MIVKGVTVLAPLLKAVCNLVYNKPVSLTPDFNHVSRNSSRLFLSSGVLNKYLTTNAKIPIIFAVVVVIKAIMTESLNSKLLYRLPLLYNIKNTSII